jgi:galactoside O-acetyltransferase
MEIPSFYTRDELADLGLGSYGKEVLISRKASLHKPEAITLGHHVRIDDFCVLSGGRGISCGKYVHIGCFCALYGGSGIRLDDYSGLSARVTVYSETDDFSGASVIGPWFPSDMKPGYIRGAVTVGRYAQVGVNCTVMPGVTLGEGVAVGAHSFVLRSCEAWTIHAGVPARFLKNRKRNVKQWLEGFERPKNGTTDERVI